MVIGGISEGVKLQLYGESLKTDQGSEMLTWEVRRSLKCSCASVLNESQSASHEHITVLW